MPTATAVPFTATLWFKVPAGITAISGVGYGVGHGIEEYLSRSLDKDPGFEIPTIPPPGWEPPTWPFPGPPPPNWPWPDTMTPEEIAAYLAEHGINKEEIAAYLAEQGMPMTALPVDAAPIMMPQPTLEQTLNFPEGDGDFSALDDGQSDNLFFMEFGPAEWFGVIVGVIALCALAAGTYKYGSAAVETVKSYFTPQPNEGAGDAAAQDGLAAGADAAKKKL